MTEIPTVGDWLDTAPWRNRAVSILSISLAGTVVQEQSLEGKRLLLAVSSPPDRLVALWTGRWRTDARRITPAEQAEIVGRLA